MALAPKLLSSPADPLSRLQHARLALVNDLPPNHDLRRRVQAGGHGELLPEQPAGRPRALLKAPPARKRGRKPGDPTFMLERHQLMTMWNEKYHLEEWSRVRDKMLEHRKRLGMRERPYREGDSCGRSRQDSSGNSSYKERGCAARRSTKKRRRNDGETLAAGNNKRRRSDSGYVEREKSHLASASGQDADTSKPSDPSLPGAVNSDKAPPPGKEQGDTSLWTGKDWNRSWSPLRTLDEIIDPPDSSIIAADPAAGPLFPTIEEALEAIPASGISMRRITELFCDRVSSNMDDFHILLHDNTYIDVDKDLIRRKGAACEEGRLALPLSDGGTDDHGRVSEMTTSDESGMVGGDMNSGYGIEVEMGVLHTIGRLLARRGGLDSTRYSRRITSVRRKRRKHADDIRFDESALLSFVPG